MHDSNRDLLRGWENSFSDSHSYDNFVTFKKEVPTVSTTKQYQIRGLDIFADIDRFSGYLSIYI